MNDAKDKFIQALRTGCKRSTAARAANITMAEVHHMMMEAAADPASDHAAFVREIEKVEAQLELLCHATVIKQAQTNPRWATWWIGHKRRSYEPKLPEVLPPELMNLRKIHRDFVLAYVVGEHRGKPRAAYRAAGYKGNGASTSASRLLRKPDIAAAVTALTEAIRSSLLATEYMDAAERRRLCSEIARDPEYPPRARLAAIRLDAELTGGFKSTVEQHEIFVDLVPHEE